MHYAPESSREFLPNQPGVSSDDLNSRSFHYRSAPIYLLTAVVGALLLTDIALGVVWGSTTGTPSAATPVAPSVDWWSKLLTTRMLFGFRLALLSAVFGGARILYQTLDGLLSGKVGADLALTIACLAAIVLGQHETAALVVFIALCGESIEGYTVDRAQRAIRRIFQLCPRTARVLVGDDEHEVPIESVVEGDMLVVRPGERMPVDGVVAAGQSAVDQSALTGESVPVDNAIGDAVLAAMAWLARTGVVVKGSLALERLAAVDSFVFDKTGTLTRGELAVGDVWLRESSPHAPREEMPNAHSTSDAETGSDSATTFEA